ncbi:auxin-responsive protein SAUR78-like [Rhodamnia argentea]|uniref:Auxin-responsive protein SAUR78-like n=1 Tax=Rhodamnia argentea TaxID=178133 RepID=A0A8B8NPI7_9MYRT|nr:auxin-responsive protein SAUR78-like [Rhodamnia argentea]
MAKTGKLTKLKSAIKRFPSFSKLSRSNSTAAAEATEDDPRSAAAAGRAGRNVRAVYVGKSRRRYDVSADVFEHPLFQELVDKSSSSSSSPPSSAAVVSCEVVLFEHLLWMLENTAGGGDAQLGAMDELVEFYTTC